MDSELLEKLYELKSALKSDERILQLNAAEEKMNNSEEVAFLAAKKEQAVDEYNFALSHFDKDSEEVNNAQKKLHIAKKELDLHPLVIDYMEKYKIVRDLYAQINDEIFSIINKDKCHGGCSQ